MSGFVILAGYITLIAAGGWMGAAAAAVHLTLMLSAVKR